ncbi:MAG: methyltransferase domain-containing protein [Bacteroidales bacterium]|nr:methyltransferase domain-containing protein [Bacteroidales bacterium]MCF8402550.1 methyltransferase domain-containing protein [Bacteroidales bacterium]
MELNTRENYIFPEQLINVLICPKCKSADLRFAKDEAFCNNCGQHFPVVDGFFNFDWQPRSNSNLKDLVTNANEELHDSYADYYEKSDLNQVFTEESFLHTEKLLSESAKKYGKERLLDLGCGTGFIINVSQKHFDEIYGIDVSRKSLKLASKYNAHLVCGSVYSTPFSNDSFNVITANATLHHLYDFHAFFEEVYRILKPGGVLLIDHDPNAIFRRYFGWQKLLRRMMLRKKRKNIVNCDKEVAQYADYHQFKTSGIKPKKVKALLAKSGFKNVEVFYTFPLKPDQFTQILIGISRYIDSPSLRYLVGFIAQK